MITQETTMLLIRIPLDIFHHFHTFEDGYSDLIYSKLWNSNLFKNWIYRINKKIRKSLSVWKRLIELKLLEVIFLEYSYNDWYKLKSYMKDKTSNYTFCKHFFFKSNFKCLTDKIVWHLFLSIWGKSLLS